MHPSIMKAPDSHQEHVEMNLLDGGSLSYLAGGSVVTLSGGRLVVFWAAVPHQIVSCSRVRALYWVHIPLSRFLAWGLPGDFVTAVMDGKFITERDGSHNGRDALLLQQWVDDLAGEDRACRAAAHREIEARLLRMSRTVTLQTPKHADDMLLAAARRIGNEYTGDIGVADIAASFSISPDALAERFRARFGMTITQSINRHRVFHAQRLLAASDTRILDIAFEAGFGSLTQFNTVFRAVCGVRPKEYRSRARGRT